jgi:aminoglycoside phosphotransferase
LARTHDLSVAGDVLVKRYVSWDRGEHRREWTILSVLHAAVPELVPQPLRSGLDDSPPWLAMTCVPGEPLDGDLTASQLDALEAALRRIWSVPAGSLPPRRFASAEAFSVIRDRFAASTRPLGVAGKAFDAAVALLAGPSLSDVEPTIVGHGDPNLANYLWDGVRVWVVDFEDAGRSDVAYELATLVEHLSARPLEADAFCARFDDLVVDSERLLVARALWAAFWLHLLLPGGPAARRNPPGMLDTQARRLLDLLR